MMRITACFVLNNYINFFSIYSRHTMKQISILLLLSLLSVQLIEAVKFVHPGLLHTTADLQRMKSMVAAEREPWQTAFRSFAADNHSSLLYSIQGPDAVVTRDVNSSITNVGNSHLAHDSTAALQLSLMYSITGNDSYAALATKILEEWTNTLIIINGILVFIKIRVCLNKRNYQFRVGCTTCSRFIRYTVSQCCRNYTLYIFWMAFCQHF
jgi:hypothetical protein